MFKKILVATDGSEASLEAARLADRYAEKGMADEIHLVTVGTDFADGKLGVTLPSFDDLNSYQIKQGEKILEDTAKVITHAEKLVQKSLLGSAATVICDYADKNGCDLVIMGSHGSGQIKGLLLGSVSTRVLHYCNVPVTIVKE